MNDPSSDSASRRQIITRAALAFGSLTALTDALGADRRQEADEAHLTHLRQEVVIAAGPHRVYEAILDANQFAALTKATAMIDRKPGGAFSTFGGTILGRTVDLVPDKRIVQAWRVKYWEPGVYSIVKFELAPSGTGTKVVLDHTGFPEGAYAGLNSGWPERYWEPLKKYFA